MNTYCLSSDATIMVSHKCPIIGKQVILFIWKVTKATIQPVKITLNFSFKYL